MNTDYKSYFFTKIESRFNERTMHTIWRMLNEDLFSLKPLENQKQLDGLIERLLNDEPVQYITGKQYFYESLFHVNKHVLIPRVETEELVYLILSENQSNKLNVLDIGTGSACIAISLARQKTDWKIDAFDISNEALKIARKNNEALNTAVCFQQVDILNPIDNEIEYDIIVSNPPYIPLHEKSLMSKSVLEYEPELALFVDNDKSMLFYQAIIKYAKSHLKKGGKLYFECNEYNAEDVLSLLKNNDFDARIHLDLQGKQRMTSAVLNTK